MMQNGQLYQQVLWEPVIREADGGSLPTPLASVGNRRAKFAQGGTPLLGALLPIPTAMDHLPQRSVDSMVKQVTEHRKGRTNLVNLREAVNPKTVQLFNQLQSGETQNINSIKTGKDTNLNPHFVEEMMGYPIEWTDLKH